MFKLWVLFLSFSSPSHVEAQSLPKKKARNPQSPFSSFSWELSKTKYILPFHLIHKYKFSLLLPEKISFKQALFQASIHPPLAVPPLSCANIPGSAKHWNGGVTDGMSGSLHVLKSGRQKYLKNSILCFGTIYVMDFQGLGSCVCCILGFVVFFFKPICIYLGISSKLLASLPLLPL